jgi:hypothetical protein
LLQAGLDLAIGRLAGAARIRDYVKFTQAGAELFA